MASKKHAELIRAWLSGEKIQQVCGRGVVIDLDEPEFNEYCEYRIKPAEPERVYPATRMTAGELLNVFSESKEVRTALSLVDVANASLRHAIDAGQIVTREEFDRMCGDRKARDMAVAEAVATTAVDETVKSYRAGLTETVLDLEEIISKVQL